MAAVLHNLAWLYRATGDHGKAEPLSQRALSITERALGQEHPHTAKALQNLALLYQETGAYTKAEPLFRRALSITEKALGPEHPQRSAILGGLSVLHWASGDLTTAQSLVREILAIDEKNLMTFLVTGSESRKYSYVLQLLGTTFGTVTLSLGTKEKQSKELGFRSVLMTKGRVLEVMSESIARLRLRMNPKDRDLFEQLTAVSQQLSTLIYHVPEKLESGVNSQRFQKLMVQKEQFEEDLSNRSVEFHHEIAPVTIATVQAGLDRNSALIEWLRYHPFDTKGQQSKWGKPRYVAYVLKSNGELDAEDIGDAETIEPLIQEFRKGLGDPKRTYVRETGRELYKTLIKPLGACPTLPKWRDFRGV